MSRLREDGGLSVSDPLRYERQRKSRVYAQHRLAGLCVRCDKPATSLTLCDDHRSKAGRRLCADLPATARQLDVLRFVRDRIAADGWAPSHREIGAALGIRSTNGVAEHLDSLEKKGLLVNGGQARQLRLTEKGKATP